jgi:hypothetical protein
MRTSLAKPPSTPPGKKDISNRQGDAEKSFCYEEKHMNQYNQHNKINFKAVKKIISIWPTLLASKRTMPQQ